MSQTIHYSVVQKSFKDGDKRGERVRQFYTNKDLAEKFFKTTCDSHRNEDEYEVFEENNPNEFGVSQHNSPWSYSFELVAESISYDLEERHYCGNTGEQVLKRTYSFTDEKEALNKFASSFTSYKNNLHHDLVELSSVHGMKFSVDTIDNNFTIFIELKPIYKRCQ